MLSIFLLIPLSLMLFVVAIWAVRYAVKSNQFEDLDNASQRIILDDRQERRQTMQAHNARNEEDAADSIVEPAVTAAIKSSAIKSDHQTINIDDKTLDK